MSLTIPPSVQNLQLALHDKTKGSPNFRLHALYDKVYREDVMAFAYECCKANRGAAGVDGQTFEDIEEYGLKKWLDELTQELKSRTYQPQPVRRVWIPAGRETKTVRSARDQRSRSTDGGSSGVRTDLGGRPAAGTVRLSG
jgi:hypothetical protein